MRITLPLILSSVLLLSACESMSSGPEVSLKTVFSPVQLNNSILPEN